MTWLYIALALLGLIAFIMLNRHALVSVGRWVLHRRYNVQLSGTENLEPNRTYLIFPNHPALVDPFVLATELYKCKVIIRPLIDESFFSNRLFKHIFMMFNAVRVPDFRRINFRPILKVRPSLKDSARRAKELGATVLSTLREGGSVLLYPSGHITSTGKEEMSNRQLAHNIINSLPKNVQVIGVRMRGLYGSMWSRVNGRPAPRFTWTFVKAVLLWLPMFFWRRRKVTLHFENITDKLKSWAPEGRKAFNDLLEKWYDADLLAMGATAEPIT